MSIMIKSEISSQYLLEEDAVEGFKTAVANGQVRLALQIMTEIVDGIMEIFDAALGDDEDDDTSATAAAAEVPAPSAVEEAAKESAPIKEKKEPAKKAQEEKTETVTAPK
jgi:hypothetical protein